MHGNVWSEKGQGKTGTLKLRIAHSYELTVFSYAHIFSLISDRWMALIISLTSRLVSWQSELLRCSVAVKLS